jgi:hypothetical protein
MAETKYPIFIIDDIPHKECSQCHEIKATTDYHKTIRTSQGIHARCKVCCKEFKRLAYEGYKPKISEYNKENREEINKKQNKRRVNRRDSDNKNQRRRYKENHEERLAKKREYEKKNKEKIRETARNYRRKRREDPTYRLRQTIRSSVRKAFDRYSKNGKIKTCEQYGIDFEGIFNRIGVRPGSGKDWHLDHIIPMSKFDFDNPEHVRLAHSPENLQWLGAYENDSKSNSYTFQIFDSPVLINILKIIGRYEEACLECFGTTNHEIEKESQNAT